jgi:hypothetical protein
MLEALDQHQVAALQPVEQIVQRRLRRAAQFVHQRPALVAEQQHLLAAGFAQPVRVLAGAVDIDVLVAVLDERDHQSARGDLGHEPLQQRGLAHAGVAGDSKDFHVDERTRARRWAG